MYKKLIVLLFFIFAISSLQAELKKSLLLDIPLLNVGAEFGQVTENNHYISAAGYIGLDGLTRADVDWSKSSMNRTHWYGFGVGLINGGDNIVNVDAGEASISMNYKYFYNSIDNSGFTFRTSIKYFPEDGFIIPWLGFGMHF